VNRETQRAPRGRGPGDCTGHPKKGYGQFEFSILNAQFSIPRHASVFRYA
jgi:hypothetical protein